jgi:hypothetical protein
MVGRIHLGLERVLRRATAVRTEEACAPDAAAPGADRALPRRRRDGGRAARDLRGARMRRLLCIVALLLPVFAAAGPSPGTVRFFRVANRAFDGYTKSPDADAQAWMRRHYWRMLAYSPYFDTRLAWYPDAWVYRDLYAIHLDSGLADAHPDWILHDAHGTHLYIPYHCAGGTCPQYAADVGSPDFREQWIADTKRALDAGYRGVFVDDVNLTISRVGDGTGKAVAPVDPRTDRAMTDADWRRYMAEFTEQIRSAFPKTEIVHNVLWFVGHDDPAIQRELRSADFLNLERGANDDGLRGGNGEWGFERFLAQVDWLHGQHRHVLFDTSPHDARAREYGLAAYLLVSDGEDGLGNGAGGGDPANWWNGYDVDLGAATGPRRTWNDVLRRDFERGLVLLNEPDAPARTVDVEPGYVGLDGSPRTRVTLGAAEGAVLRRGGS